MRILPLLLLLIGCPGGDDDDSAPTGPDPASWDVMAPGPFQTGYRTWEVTYQPPAQDEPRTIPVHAWYPTDDESGPGATYEFAFGDPDSFVDATAAAPVHPDGYPVHVYSHGNQGFGGASPFLARYLASHGVVTVAPDHVGNTLSTGISPRPTQLYLWRPLDVAAALDALADLPADDPLARADASRAVASGHSFGAHSVWAAGGATFDPAAIQARCDGGELDCTPEQVSAFAAGTHDPRLVGLVPMAGAPGDEWFGATGMLDVSVPVMNMAAENDPRRQQELWDRATTLDFSWVEISGGCHQLFALGGCDDIANEDGFAIVNVYALAFLRETLLDDPTVAGVLDGSVPVSDRVTYQRR